MLVLATNEIYGRVGEPYTVSHKVYKERGNSRQVTPNRCRKVCLACNFANGGHHK